MYHVLMVCGLRPGEAFGLTWESVNLARGTLAVRQAVTFGTGREPVLAEPKTAGSRRSMPIPPELVQVLSEHKDRTRDIHNSLGLVFPSYRRRVDPPEQLVEASETSTASPRRLGFPRASDCTTCGTLARRSCSATVRTPRSWPRGSVTARRS
ncbi:MAG: hypothetical protein WD336_02635 [Trueperaceae bacterium]